jgi:hypothetical protein
VFFGSLGRSASGREGRGQVDMKSKQAKALNVVFVTRKPATAKGPAIAKLLLRLVLGCYSEQLRRVQNSENIHEIFQPSSLEACSKLVRCG